MEITLKSGRKVDYKDLDYFQELEIWDLSAKYSSDKIPTPYLVFGKCVAYATEININELQKWPKKDILELGGIIFNKIVESEKNKKKLK